MSRRAESRNRTPRKPKKSSPKESGPEDECYTSDYIVEAARASLGGTIDLDPFSCREANKVVGAAHFFSKKVDGFAQPWHGRIFLNPPFSLLRYGAVTDKVVLELKSGRVVALVMLVNANVETAWFRAMATLAQRVCFLDHRAQFTRPNAKIGKSSNKRAQAILYFGPDPDLFENAFEHIGTLWEPSEERLRQSLRWAFPEKRVSREDSIEKFIERQVANCPPHMRVSFVEPSGEMVTWCGATRTLSSISDPPSDWPLWLKALVQDRRRATLSASAS